MTIVEKPYAELRPLIPALRELTLPRGRMAATLGYLESGARLPGTALLAYDGDALAGWATFSPAPGGAVLDFDVFVAGAHRRGGVGSALAARAGQLAGSAVRVVEHDTASREFYGKAPAGWTVARSWSWSG